MHSREALLDLTAFGRTIGLESEAKDEGGKRKPEVNGRGCRRRAEMNVESGCVGAWMGDCPDWKDAKG